MISTILFFSLISYFFPSVSGCFGGQPDIYPLSNTKALPTNTIISVTRKDVRAIRWVESESQQAVDYREAWVGKGKSKSRILYPLKPLKTGSYQLHTTEPDEIRSFEVGEIEDEKPPCFKNSTLVLEGYHRPQPGNECPTNSWIKCEFLIPKDDVTTDDAFSYLVFFSKQEKADFDKADLLVHAEHIRNGKVSFRVGETGCGCLPKYPLSPGENYELSLFVMDRSGKVGTKALYGKIIMPD